MNAKSKARLKAMRSTRGYSLRATDGEPITVRIQEDGKITLSSRLRPDHGGLGDFNVTGLEPTKAAAKKKGFWRRLWEKIKDAIGAVVDAVTVPLFGYRCRPDIDIDLSDNRFVFGIKCKEA